MRNSNQYRISKIGRLVRDFITPFGFLGEFSKKGYGNNLVNTQGWKNFKDSLSRTGDTWDKQLQVFSQKFNNAFGKNFDAVGGDMNAQGVQNPTIYSGNLIQRLLYGSQIDAMNAAEVNRYNSEMQAYEENYNSVANQIKQYQDAGLNYYYGMQQASPVATSVESAVTAPDTAGGAADFLSIVSQLMQSMTMIQGMENNAMELQLKREQLELQKSRFNDEHDLNQLKLTQLALENDMRSMTNEEKKILHEGLYLLDDKGNYHKMSIGEALSNPDYADKVPQSVIDAYYNTMILQQNLSDKQFEHSIKAADRQYTKDEQDFQRFLWQQTKDMSEDTKSLLKSKASMAAFTSENMKFDRDSKLIMQVLGMLLSGAKMFL